MKKQVSFLFFGLFFITLFSFAQQKTVHTSKAAQYLSDKGYWTIESNLNTPKNSIIYFYTMQNQLVYKETIEGMRIRLHKRKILERLKKVLEQSVLAYEQNHSASKDQMLVTRILKK